LYQRPSKASTYTYCYHLLFEPLELVRIAIPILWSNWSAVAPKDQPTPSGRPALPLTHSGEVLPDFSEPCLLLLQAQAKCKFVPWKPMLLSGVVCLATNVPS